MENHVIEDRARLPAIPGYELHERIGEGGMGRVYRATDLRQRRSVAIKFLTPPESDHPSMRDFHREARLMASVHHANVVATYDCGEVDGAYYLVMEYVDGTNLRSQMRPDQPWGVAQAAQLLDRVAQALSSIHAEGVLHLDLKPENILLAAPRNDDPPRDGQRDVTTNPKITDFGLAAFWRDDVGSARPALAYASIDYCPPEQRYGLPVDQRSDLFSLATIAYELLTGRLPGRVFTPTTARNPQLPGPVDEVLRRALSRDPDERQPTVADFRHELLQALERSSGNAKLPAVVVMVGLAAALTLPFILGAWWSHAGRAGPAPTPANRDDLVEAWLVRDPNRSSDWLLNKELRGLLERMDATLQVREVGSEQPDPLGDLSLPCWPAPRPVLALYSTHAIGFVHPLVDPGLLTWVLARWPTRLDRETALLDNADRIQAGGFGGPCLTDANGPGPWKFDGARVREWLRGDGIAVETVPDDPAQAVLSLTKHDTLHPERTIGCAQQVNVDAASTGQLHLLRYRARAVEGRGRLTLGPRYGLHLAGGNDDPVQARLRAMLADERIPDAAASSDKVDFCLRDWVTPGATWTTYYVLWEQPPRCEQTMVIDVAFAGIGKVWVDDVRLFVWEGEVKP